MSVFIAYERAIHDQRTRASLLADEVLHRAEETTEQLFRGYQAVNGVNPSNVCSDSNIIRMRKIALSSPYLGGFGYIAGNRLLCSSFGSQPYSVDVGVPDLVSATGYTIRLPRQLDIAPGVPLLLVSATDGFTGFFHPALVLSLSDGDDISLGVVSAAARILLMSTGAASFDWKRLSIPAAGDSVTLNNGQLLAIRPSLSWDQFAYAAVPIASVVSEFAKLLPLTLILGVICGIIGVNVTRRLMAQRQSLQALLKIALKRNQIYVEYQPIVDMNTGRWVGAEVLARWRLDNGEQVPPDVFIPLAEEHGLISEITATIVALGIGQLAPLLKAQPGMFVTLNFSPHDLEGTRILPLLEDTVVRNDLRPRNVHIEITERKSVSTPEQVAAIDRLRARGFEVGTDDFGVGFSNLGYLNLIPLDYVKIDRSLMIDGLHDNQPFDIVETIVRLAHARGILLIAEGVETEVQRRRLTACGVDFGQGWLFARPLPPLEFTARFARLGSGDILDPRNSTPAPSRRASA